MNNTFSLHRVALYARKHYVENGRSYLFGLLALTALSILALPYFRNTAAPVVMLMTIGWIYFTQVCAQSHYAKRSIEQSYTLPVTSFEKYLFMWFNSAVLIPLLTTGIILLISAISSTVLNKAVGLSIEGIELQVTTLLFLYQAGALFCCCWVKGSPLKAYAITAGILIGLFSLYGLTFQYLIPYLQYSIDITNGSCYSYIDAARIRYPLANNISGQYTITSFLGFWIVVFWVVGYFKFKERTLK